LASDSKTEKATPKKRRDERKKGNIFQSKDITTVFSILAIFFAIKILFPFVYTTISSFLVKYISYIHSIKEISVAVAMDILKESMIAFFITVGPIMIVAMFVGVIASGVQTKFLFSKDALKPKFSRLDFFKGIQKMFALRSVVELIKSMIKVVAISYVLYAEIKSIIAPVKSMMTVGVNEAILFIFDSIMDTVIKISMVFGIIAFMDFLYQWWEYEKSLKMTKQETKEEYKHMEGDPEIKGKIKAKQREIANSRMMQAVPTADVIIRNPTHFAIAIKYDIEKDDAPIVVAKGQDYTALKIIEIAEKNNIPTTENKPLARALFETVELNMQIPGEYFSVLAEIMAWVYTLKEKELKR